MMRPQHTLQLWCGIALLPVAQASAAPIPADKALRCQVVAVLAAAGDPRLHLPTDVAVSASGRIYVADGVNDRLLRFEADGQAGVSIGAISGEDLANPLAVTSDAGGRLWIADNGNHRVVVASADGDLLEVVVLPPAAGGQPADPTDVAVTLDGKQACVVDNDHHRLLLRDNDSGLITVIGEPGDARGQLRWPFMAAVLSDGEMLVTEAIGARVQRLVPPDRWTGQISRWGVQLGELYRPKGIAVDDHDRVYVGDSTTGAVQVFHHRGRLLGVLVDEAGQVRRFSHPMGLCFDAQGRLLVVEMTGQRVAVVTVELPLSTGGGQP
jgi:DNA-binding beta-propeller fold protein YncE